VLFALTVSTVHETRMSSRESGAVIPPTMVKIMTLECHAHWKLTPFLLELPTCDSPQQHVFLRSGGFLRFWQSECWTQPCHAVGWNNMSNCVSQISARRS